LIYIFRISFDGVFVAIQFEHGHLRYIIKNSRTLVGNDWIWMNPIMSTIVMSVIIGIYVNKLNLDVN